MFFFLYKSGMDTYMFTQLILGLPLENYNSVQRMAKPQSTTEYDYPIQLPIQLYL